MSDSQNIFLFLEKKNTNLEGWLSWLSARYANTRACVWFPQNPRGKAGCGGAYLQFATGGDIKGLGAYWSVRLMKLVSSRLSGKGDSVSKNKMKND